MKRPFNAALEAAIAIIFLPVCVSLARADQVIMKNGDRVTGAVVKKDGKELTIKTVQFGTVTTRWEEVESIQTDQPVTVTVDGGPTVEGTLNTSGGNIVITSQTGNSNVAPLQISALRDREQQRAYQRLQHPG